MSDLLTLHSLLAKSLVCEGRPVSPCTGDMSRVGAPGEPVAPVPDCPAYNVAPWELPKRGESLMINQRSDKTYEIELGENVVRCDGLGCIQHCTRIQSC